MDLVDIFETPFPTIMFKETWIPSGDLLQFFGQMEGIVGFQITSVIINLTTTSSIIYLCLDAVSYLFNGLLCPLKISTVLMSLDLIGS